MMISINNKRLTPQMVEAIRSVERDVSKAETIVIAMRIDGRDYVYDASWLKFMVVPNHEREVARSIAQEMQERNNVQKENPNGTDGNDGR